MRKDIEISLRDLGGSSYYNVYVGSACFTIDFLFFKDSEYRVPKELERVVLQYCISFNTTLRTEHHGIHEIQLRTGKQFCIPTNFSVEHIINRIKLEASSCCSVCRHRNGYGGCNSAEYGQNWSYAMYRSAKVSRENRTHIAAVIVHRNFPNGLKSDMMRIRTLRMSIASFLDGISIR